MIRLDDSFFKPVSTTEKVWISQDIPPLQLGNTKKTTDQWLAKISVTLPKFNMEPENGTQE